VVIAAVGVQTPGEAQWLAALAADRRDGLDQRDELGDVVAVAAGGACRERDGVRPDDQVVLAAVPTLPRSQELGFGLGMTCWRRLRDWNEAGM
jgi:hypothetical protein